MAAATMSFNPTEPHRKELKTDLSQFATRRLVEGPYADNLDVGALIVGAGLVERTFYIKCEQKLTKPFFMMLDRIFEQSGTFTHTRQSNSVENYVSFLILIYKQRCLY